MDIDDEGRVCTRNLLGRTVIRSITVFGNRAWDVSGAQKTSAFLFFILLST